MLHHFKPVTCAITASLLAASMLVFPPLAVAQSQPPSWMIPDLAVAAKAEGELTVYGSMNEEEALPFWQLFQDSSGIKVNYVRSSDANILARIAIEYRARQRTWDLVATTPVYRLPDEVLLQFEPGEAKNLIPQARAPNRRWYGSTATTTRPPTTPIWSRKPTCRRPTRNSSITRNGPARSRSTLPIPNG